MSSTCNSSRHAPTMRQCWKGSKRPSKVGMQAGVSTHTRATAIAEGEQAAAALDVQYSQAKQQIQVRSIDAWVVSNQTHYRYCATRQRCSCTTKCSS